ncbi:MAG: cytidylate kinase family protein, partial [Candidatus Bathyarchaeota archaeon]|nr:cytidylate kinase family protein [Candidatus Bathyarchaeota archaeon]
AKAISKEFNLRHVSAGALFRQIAAERGLSIEELSRTAERDKEIDHLIDDRTRGEASRRDVVLDGLLAGWMARDYADVKIYLKCPDNVRMHRIAERDGITSITARRTTILRETTEKRRFKKLYGIDMDDLSIYDLIINTGLMSLRSNIEVIKTFVQEYISSQGGER